MKKPPTSRFDRVIANNTVKLPLAMRGRVANAMLAGGFSVWAEFCRVALTEKCHATENALRLSDPAAFQQIYGAVRPIAP